MWIIIVVAYLALALVLHAVLVRVLNRSGAVINFLFAGSAAGIALIVQVVPRGFDYTTAAIVLSYALACELYIFLFTIVGNSISAAIILTLGRTPLTPHELDDRYSSRGMVERRLDKLVSRGFLERGSAADYKITKKGLGCIVTFSRLGSFFRHPEPLNDSNEALQQNE